MHNDFNSYFNSHNKHAVFHTAQEFRNPMKAPAHIGWRILGATVGLAGVAMGISAGVPQLVGNSIWLTGAALFSQDY